MRELLAKYWDGTISPEEKNSLYIYLTGDNYVFRQQLSDEFSLAIGEPRTIERYAIRNRAKKYFRTISFTAAASLVILFGLYRYFQKEKETESLKTNLVHVQVIENNYLDKSLYYKLSDGSTFKLLPGGKVSIPPTYNISERNIELITGAAFFNVEKNRKNKFIVKSKSYTITALGTQFLVENQKDELKILLHEGKVVINSLSTAEHQILSNYMNPGDAIIIKPASNYLRKYNFNVIQPIKENVTASKHFNNKITSETVQQRDLIQSENKYVKERLTVVFNDLSIAYKVSIRYSSNDISDKLFTGSIKKSDSISDIMNIICQSNDLHVEINGQIYTISKK